MKSINVICSATGICLGPCWTGVTFLSISRLLVNILARNPYFFPTPEISKPLFLPCFFISEKFVVIIIVIIFTYVFVEYEVLVEGDDFLSKSWKRRS